MALNELKEEIINKANEEAEKIRKEAETKAEEIVAAAKKNAQGYLDKAKEETDKIIEVLQRREVASAALEAKKKMMAAKKNMIDSVFASVVEKLKKMPKKERKALIEKMLKSASKQIKLAVVYCNELDAGFVKGYKTVKQDMLGGIIGETSDGLLRVDYSFETLLDEIREKHLSEIVSELF